MAFVKPDENGPLRLLFREKTPTSVMLGHGRYAQMDEAALGVILAREWLTHAPPGAPSHLLCRPKDSTAPAFLCSWLETSDAAENILIYKAAIQQQFDWRHFFRESPRHAALLACMMTQIQEQWHSHDVRMEWISADGLDHRFAGVESRIAWRVHFVDGTPVVDRALLVVPTDTGEVQALTKRDMAMALADWEVQIPRLRAKTGSLSFQAPLHPLWPHILTN